MSVLALTFVVSQFFTSRTAAMSPAVTIQEKTRHA